jgi:hypothetical protein
VAKIYAGGITSDQMRGAPTVADHDLKNMTPDRVLDIRLLQTA